MVTHYGPSRANQLHSLEIGIAITNLIDLHSLFVYPLPVTGTNRYRNSLIPGKNDFCKHNIYINSVKSNILFFNCNDTNK